MLSLILPTFNEAKNIPELIPVFESVLRDIPHEIIIVDDDSPDKTWEIAGELALTYSSVRVIRRVGRKGLSSAVIEGFLSSKGDVLAVMDADGQHDMNIVPVLYEKVKSGECGIAIGSRFTEGGSVGSFDESRYLMSRAATWLAVKLCKVRVRDPMSGFFAIRRSLFETARPKLNPKGFKILLDLLVHVPKETKAEEIPYLFGERLHGDSKMSTKVKIEFLEYLYDVTIGRYIPMTFVKYCIVGTIGVAVNMIAYKMIEIFVSKGLPPTVQNFSISVIGATETAIIFNFLLNNSWTFSHQRLRGKAAFAGFLKFNGACIFGAIANFAVSTFLFISGWSALAAVFTGAMVGVSWNYAMNRVFTWKK